MKSSLSPYGKDTASLVYALTTTWWVIFPPFAALVANLIWGRAQSNLYDVPSWAFGSPVLSWAASVVYLAGHCWALGVYLLATNAPRTLLPKMQHLRAISAPIRSKAALFALALALEYAPARVWYYL